MVVLAKQFYVELFQENVAFCITNVSTWVNLLISQANKMRLIFNDYSWNVHGYQIFLSNSSKHTLCLSDTEYVSSTYIAYILV